MVSRCDVAYTLLVRSLPDGAEAFPGVTAAGALWSLRVVLKSVGVRCAGQYRTHDLRRGHAQDMLESGATLVEILRAGEWG